MSLIIIMKLTWVYKCAVVVNAKLCDEGLSFVKTNCVGEDASTPCWEECRRRHGPSVKAWCNSVYPVLPYRVCWCTWRC